jgi:hypothetical protein
LAKAECALELNKDIDELCGYNKNTGSITINVRVYNADLKKPPFQTFGFRKKYDCAAPPTITSSDLKKILGG